MCLWCLSILPLLSQAFDLASGAMLPCLIPVYSYMFDRWNPDMIWHVYVLPGDSLTCFGMLILACLCCRVWFLFIHIRLTGVLLTWVAGKRWKAFSTTKCCVFHCFWNVMVGITRSKVIVCCCRQRVTQTDVCLKRLHSTEHLNKGFAIKSSQACNTNLIKADKWNHLNVLTSVLPDAALSACSILHVPSSINEGQCTTPASYWETLADHF